MADPTAAVQQFLDHLISDATDAALAMCATDLRRALTAPELAHMWRSTRTRFGALAARGRTATRLQLGYHVVAIEVCFSRGSTFVWLLSVSADGQIAGLDLQTQREGGLTEADLAAADS